MSNYSDKLKIESNRIRCLKCNSDVKFMIFVIEDLISSKTILKSPARKCPIIFTGKTIMLDRYKELIIQKKCIRAICSKCGSSRKLGVVNNLIS